MSLSDGRALCVYRYDALNRITVSAPASSDSVQRFYKKNRLTTEIEGQIQRTVFQTEDHLLAQHDGQSGCALFASDQQRSVLHGLDATQQQAVVYAPYGARHPHADPLELLGFTGERADPVTGHYLLGNGYRAFNPVLMRFNSPDSLSPFGEGGLNTYAYCVGDPVNRVDPMGHFFNFLRRPLKFLGLIKKTSHTTDPRMREFTSLGGGAYSFADTFEGARRLNISAHGEGVPLGNPTRIAINKKLWSPHQLHDAMKAKGYSFNHYNSVRLIFCGSASGGSGSFAAEFAKLSQRPTIGFKGLTSDNHSIQSVSHVISQFKEQHPKNHEKQLTKFYSRKKLIIRQPESQSEVVTFEPTKRLV